ncbi:response regulator [Vreelandella venusta]|uniref:response regulator n=1 Tax=Vreelandella venusta TaxID=44935 RepID=UPI00384F057E
MSQYAATTLLCDSIQGLPSATMAFSAAGQCWAANTPACELMALKQAPGSFEEAVRAMPVPLAHLLTVLWQCYQQGGRLETVQATFRGRHFSLHGTALGEPCDAHHGVMFTLEERTQEVRQETQLEVFRQGVANYREMKQEDARWTFILDALKRITNSEYALIGEVASGADAVPSLRIHAISDLSWSEESRQLMEKLRSGEMTLSNPKSLLGRVFAHGETVLTNELNQHPHRGGFPPGHPTIYNFLGLPIYDADQLIGMIGVANASQGYSTTLAEELRPFLVTCGLLINLYRDSRQREEMMRHLEAARDDAERANRAKDDFLASMSHELRTPLNSILGYAQLLSRLKGDMPPKVATFSQHIVQSGQQLLAQISDLLDFANLGQAPSPVPQVPVQLNDVIDDVIHHFQPLAAQQAIHIVCDLATPVWANGERLRIQRILHQLVSNAIKFQPDGGQVALTMVEGGQEIGIAVTDQGKGIDSAHHEAVFVPFNRLDAGMGVVEGTGVGLSLANHLAKSLSGRITLVSELDKGACFTLWLCRALPPSALSPAADISDTQGTALEAGDRAVRCLLYVEDNRINQRLMQKIIASREHWRMDLAGSAEEGLEKLDAHAYDLVLMDISLPGMDGYAALKHIRANQRTAHLPVVAVSAHASDDDIQRGLQQGFNDYMTKPVDIERLQHVLEHHLTQTPRANRYGETGNW